MRLSGRIVACVVFLLLAGDCLDAQTRRRPTRRRRGRTIRVGGKPNPARLFHQKIRDDRMAERKRLSRDLIYWRRLLAKNPPVADASGSLGAERQRAMFHVGVLYIRSRRWKQATATFESLIRKYPAGPWTISARCRLIDLKLEYSFDLSAAESELKTVMTWARTKEKKYFPPKKRGKKSGKKTKGGITPKKGGAKPASGGLKPVVKRGRGRRNLSPRIKPRRGAKEKLRLLPARPLPQRIPRPKTAATGRGGLRRVAENRPENAVGGPMPVPRRQRPLEPRAAGGQGDRVVEEAA